MNTLELTVGFHIFGAESRIQDLLDSFVVYWQIFHFATKHKCQRQGGTRRKVRGGIKVSIGFILRGPRMFSQKFMAIHSVAVEKFQFRSEWWTA